MLVEAQRSVDAALKSAVYTTDAAGENPTDAAVIAALKIATCAQVKWWIDNGDEYDQASQYSSFSIDGISVTRGAGVGGPRLCERALNALQLAKLLPGTVSAT
jgi:hypothetical protein